MHPTLTSMAAVIAASLVTAPASAQTAPEPKAPPAKTAPAKDSLGKVTWDKVSGNWKRFTGSVRKQWGRLTANEVQIAKGDRQALNGFIQARYGINRDAADKQIDEWLKTLK